MTVDAGQAGVRGDPLAPARERADDPALERGGGDDRARPRGRGNGARSVAAHVRCGQRRARAGDRRLRRPTLARSRRSPASPNGTNRSRPRSRPSRRAAERRGCGSPGCVPRRSVNAPVRTAGAAPPAGGIVLERSFADALGLRVGSTAPARRRGAVRSSCRWSARRSHPASRAIRAATPAWPGSDAARSSGSSRIAAAGAGCRRSGSPIPPPPPPSLRVPRQRCRPGPLPPRPGRTTARRRCARRSRPRSSSRPTRSCCSSSSSRSWRSSSARAPPRSTARSGC